MCLCALCCNGVTLKRWLKRKSTSKQTKQVATVPVASDRIALPLVINVENVLSGKSERS